MPTCVELLQTRYFVVFTAVAFLSDCIQNPRWLSSALLQVVSSIPALPAHATATSIAIVVYVFCKDHKVCLSC